MPPKAATSWAISGLVIAAIFLVGGCGGIQLYNKGKDELATKARDDFTNIKLATVVGVERKHNASIRKLEVGLAKRSVRTRGQMRIYRLVLGDEEGEPVARTLWTSRDMRDRLATLGIPDNRALFAAGLLKKDFEKWVARLNETRLEVYGVAGNMPEPCLPDFKLGQTVAHAPGMSAENQSIAQRQFNKYRTQCETAKKAIEGRLKKFQFDDIGAFMTSGGGIATALRDWVNTLAEVRARKAAAGKAEAAFNQAYAAHAAATQAAENPDIGGKIEAAAKIMKDALAVLEAAGDAASIEFVAEERRKAVDRLIEAVAAGEAPAAAADPSLDRAVAVAASVKPLAESVAAFVKAGTAPAISSLAIERQHQKLRRDYARQRIKRQEELARIKQRQWGALLDEAAYYRETRLQLCRIIKLAAETPPGREIVCDSLEVKVAPLSCSYTQRIKQDDGSWDEDKDNRFALQGDACPLSATLTDALAGNVGVANDKKIWAKKAVNLAVAAYINANDLAGAKQVEYTYDEFALHAEAALDADEFAVNAWNTLIAEPLNGLARYHAGGLHADAVAAALANLIGLGAIAVGVNR